MRFLEIDQLSDGFYIIQGISGSVWLVPDNQTISMSTPSSYFRTSIRAIQSPQGYS